jgi:acetate kinase
LGVEIDPAKNKMQIKNSGKISPDSSKVSVLAANSLVVDEMNSIALKLL